MKLKLFFAAAAVAFALQITAAVLFLTRTPDTKQDAVQVNEIVETLKNDWDNLSAHTPVADRHYVVLSPQGDVLYRTKTGLSETLNAAVQHRDTVLDVVRNGVVVGRVLLYNDSLAAIQAQRRAETVFFIVALCLEAVVCCGYLLYFNRAAIRPFRRLQGFAARVAHGNFDVPLDMDRHNLFGAFSESFDVMRDELKRARAAEAKANNDKKELIAKLSHDIRTPVASVKAAAETGAAVAESEKTAGIFRQINAKADQIDALVTNLFSSALEDLQQLRIELNDMGSDELTTMLQGADYLCRASAAVSPPCLLHCDKLRLQQVFDNLFTNAYKYAGTEIQVSYRLQSAFLAVEIEDFGGGVAEKELPLLTQKYRRGENAHGKQGAGLGLYICREFMQKAGGGLTLENTPRGFKATVEIPLSGKSDHNDKT